MRLPVQKTPFMRRVCLLFIVPGLLATPAIAMLGILLVMLHSDFSSIYRPEWTFKLFWGIGVTLAITFASGYVLLGQTIHFYRGAPHHDQAIRLWKRHQFVSLWIWVLVCLGYSAQLTWNIIPIPSDGVLISSWVGLSVWLWFLSGTARMMVLLLEKTKYAYLHQDEKVDVFT